MSFLELAGSRRSVRSFDGAAIRREDLELCVEAARLAPSACNSQPWKFIVIDDAPLKEAVGKECFGRPSGFNDFARRAAAFITLVAEPVKFTSWAGSKARNTDFRRIDLGIACSHLVLQAQELGIGTCILGWFDEARLKKLLSVPRKKKIELVVAMGYPAGAASHERHLKGKEDVLSFNRY